MAPQVTPQMATTAGARAWLMVTWDALWITRNGTTTKELGPFSVAFPDTLAVKCIGSTQPGLQLMIICNAGCS